MEGSIHTETLSQRQCVFLRLLRVQCLRCWLEPFQAECGLEPDANDTLPLKVTKIEKYYVPHRPRRVAKRVKFSLVASSMDNVDDEASSDD